MDLLELGESSLGCPVEIEFAANLYHEENKINEFSLLQIKPMVVGGLDRIQEFDSIQKQNILCSSSIALGNGLIDNIKNIIIVDPKSFDPGKTKLIAKQIEKINQKMIDRAIRLNWTRPVGLCRSMAWHSSRLGSNI